MEQARPEQLPPDGDWNSWLYVAGRGSGKTRTAAEWIVWKAITNNKTRWAAVGATSADVTDTMFEGESGIISVLVRYGIYHEDSYNRTRSSYTFPNGSKIKGFSAEKPDRLRGPQHHGAWCFIAGTLITTPNGDVPIEQLKIGDEVVTSAGVGRVSALGSRQAQLASVSYGGQTLTGTLDHPIYTQRGWVALANLRLNDTLRLWKNDGGQTRQGTSTFSRESASIVAQPSLLATVGIAVSGVSILEQDGQVFNLTVEPSHDYFANGVLVHNCDELAAWKYPEAWDQLQFGLRLGQNPQVIVTTTPRSIPLLRTLLKREDGSVVITRGTTFDNAANLAPRALIELQARYAGTRLGQQELYGLLLEDIEGALWPRGLIERTRVIAAPPLSRVVVSIDPAVTNTENSDETGILVCGSDTGQHGYVLEDVTFRSSPLGWAAKAIEMFDKWKADSVIVEVNQGGDTMATVLRQVRPGLPIVEVRAHIGKKLRAEPVVAMYEQGRIHHVGNFPTLEDQMTTWVPGESLNPMSSKKSADSPDRIDAMVQAFTHLMTEATVANYLNALANFCPSCNLPMSKSMSKCSACGTAMLSEAV